VHGIHLRGLPLAMLILSGLFNQSTFGQTFTILPSLAGEQGRSQVYGISGDGLTVVGSSYLQSESSGGEAFRWTASESMVGLGFLGGFDDGEDWSRARAASYDGSVIVGDGANSLPSGINRDNQAFRWTTESGMAGLGIPTGASGTNARSVSADGSVVGGSIAYAWNPPNPSYEAMRWSASTGMQGLGFVGNNGFTSSSNGVSADGSVMAGVSQELNSPYQAMRWSEEDGMVSLGTLSGFTHSIGFAVSGDGRTVAGGAYAFGSGHRTEAFSWTAAEGMRALLDNPPPDRPSGERFASWALAASHDGSVVVGQMGYQTQNGGLISASSQAFIWTQATGAQSLESILTGAGFDLDGWLLQSADALSADGQVIAGNARRAVGNGFLERGFVVDFRVVPEPSAFASALVAVGAIALRRRRGSQVYAITDT